MPFPESLKAFIRQRCDMRCCVCHTIGVEIHHIVPTCDGGLDSADNAAPLCPSCHDTYGANPIKRKFIRDSRDNWYVACEAKSAATVPGLGDLVAALNRVATKDDLEHLKGSISQELRALAPKGRKKRDKTVSLGRVLQLIYDLSLDHTEVPKDEVLFLYFFFWHTTADDEFDDVKQEFERVFGSLGAKRVCGYCLTRRPFRPLLNGFTEDEMASIGTLLFVTMVTLLHHHEIDSSPMALETGLAGERNFWSRNKAVAAGQQKPQRGGS